MAGERWRLDGRTVVVTAAARGIGAGSARRLAARGARVALLGLEPDELGRVASHCGPGAAAFPVDVTDVAALDVAVAAARERFGVLDALVANAGVAPVGMLRAADPVAFERTIEVNLLGVVRSVRAPQLLERRGYVLVIASIAAAVHAPGMAAYAAGKAGVEALADALRAELAHLGVDVGVAYPSWIGTDLIAATDADPTLSSLRAMLPGPFGRTYPVRMVGDAVVDALERRARRVYVPRWTALVVALRGLAALALERPLRGRAPEMDALRARRRRARARGRVGAPGWRRRGGAPGRALSARARPDRSPSVRGREAPRPAAPHRRPTERHGGRAATDGGAAPRPPPTGAAAPPPPPPTGAVPSPQRQWRSETRA